MHQRPRDSFSHLITAINDQKIKKNSPKMRPECPDQPLVTGSLRPPHIFIDQRLCGSQLLQIRTTLAETQLATAWNKCPQTPIQAPDRQLAFLHEWFYSKIVILVNFCASLSGRLDLGGVSLSSELCVLRRLRKGTMSD